MLTFLKGFAEEEERPGVKCRAKYRRETPVADTRGVSGWGWSGVFIDAAIGKSGRFLRERERQLAKERDATDADREEIPRTYHIALRI